MNVELEPGKYVVAVSGGVDSVALLDVLAQNAKQQTAGIELVVAHFDHGIRSDSGEDKKLVQALAARYGLPFEYAEGKLGSAASEQTARAARYSFLRRVQQNHGANAIVTAHHQDDALETAILNLLRGTGRKGLTALASNNELIRPFLRTPKSEILQYATQHHLEWREDSTNSQTRYLRNYVRLNILPRLGVGDKQCLLDIIDHSRDVNAELDSAIAGLLPASGTQLERAAFIALPHAVAREVMAAWLRGNGLRDFDRLTLERLVTAAKTGRSGSSANIYGQHRLHMTQHHLALIVNER